MLTSAVVGQDAGETNWRLAALAAHDQYGKDLAAIASWCRSNQQEQWATKTEAMFDTRDPGRQFVFLPQEAPAPQPAVGQVKMESEWNAKIAAAKKAHAARLFDIAEQACDGGDGTRSFMTLHEVLYFDPDYERARAILGHRKTDDGWRVASEKLRVKTSTRPHDRLNWPARQFIIVTTPHFNIASRADEATTRMLAEKLEKWHYVWRQVFFEYWSRTSSLKRWFEGKGKTRIPAKKFDVIFFENKDQYVADLRRWVKGIEGSTGYYENRERLSFFYASDEQQIQDTWRHEATHQWFQEAIRSEDRPFDEGFAWLGEAVAMYFESLSDYGPYVTVGGFESRRLQFARLRRLREGYKVPLAEASALGRVAFQSRDDRARLYSQSSGLAHMLMDAEGGKYQRPLTAFLKLMYQGRLKPDSFETLLGDSYQGLDEQYEEFLKVDAATIARFLAKPERRTELAVPHAKLDAAAIQQIGRCKNLQWLDLTQNDVRGTVLEKLGDCDQLTQLFLSGCLVDQQTISSLAGLGHLEELDLSGSSVEDQHLDSLEKLTQLKSVRLAGTRVSEKKLAELANKLPNLNVSKD